MLLSRCPAARARVLRICKSSLCAIALDRARVRALSLALLSPALLHYSLSRALSGLQVLYYLMSHFGNWGVFYAGFIGPSAAAAYT